MQAANKALVRTQTTLRFASAAQLKRWASNMKRWLAISLLFFSLTGISSADGDFDRARGIIGILPLPEVFGKEPCARFKAQDIGLFRTSQSSEYIGRIYVSKPWTFPPSGGCEGLEVTVSISEPVQRNERLPTLEFSYENPGAIVLKREGQWFEIALNEGYAWVRVQDGARYLPVEQLFKGALTYLRWQSQQPLLKSTNRDEAIWSPSSNIRSNLPVEVLGFREVSGLLWVRVRLLDVEPCTEESTNVIPVTGWLPFHDASGMPVIWFYSRGC